MVCLIDGKEVLQLQTGDILGEVALWSPNSTRAATIKGGDPVKTEALSAGGLQIAGQIATWGLEVALWCLEGRAAACATPQSSNTSPSESRPGERGGCDAPGDGALSVRRGERPRQTECRRSADEVYLLLSAQAVGPA